MAGDEQMKVIILITRSMHGDETKILPPSYLQYYQVLIESILVPLNIDRIELAYDAGIMWRDNRGGTNYKIETGVS
uniref:Uncharacterized protein n=1 Tax=Oryza brachyantha TaxID=4533 RepID=J3M0K1_ORYBR